MKYVVNPISIQSSSLYISISVNKDQLCACMVENALKIQIMHQMSEVQW